MTGILVTPWNGLEGHHTRFEPNIQMGASRDRGTAFFKDRLWPNAAFDFPGLVTCRHGYRATM
jgi:hypothetical protein